MALCCYAHAGKVFMAVQAHWLSACLGVMLELRVADVLLSGTKTNGKQQQAMHIDEVGAGDRGSLPTDTAAAASCNCSKGSAALSRPAAWVTYRGHRHQPMA